MKNLYPILIIVFCLLACQNAENPNATKNTPQTQPQKIRVAIDFTVENIPNGKPRISGETNLPDGTNLIVWIKGKSSKYNAQNSFAVENGKFQSEEFSDQGNKLSKGNYETEITMPVASSQPSAVKTIIGEKGENLEGSAVKTAGIDGMGNIVFLSKTFEIK